jgi:phosphohistidine phosphatase
MTRHTLLVLRHAKSDWSTGEDDRLRPLADRGRRQAPVVARWLADRGSAIDLAVVSPAVRARATWDLVAAELAVVPRVTVDDRVYGAGLEELVAVVAALPDEASTVLLVGHNPGLEDLVEDLTGNPVPMPTSAIAVLDVPSAWSAVGRGSCRLRTSGRPPP